MLPSATSLEGKRVPNVTFKTRVNDQWKDVTTDDVFSGRTVVAFGLPGAYTPTCSSAHLPRYNELADVFKANGAIGTMNSPSASASRRARCAPCPAAAPGRKSSSAAS